MPRTVLVSGLTAIVIAVNWLRFEDPRSSGTRAFVLAALAVAPALLRPLWLRCAGLLAAAVGAVWVAFSISPLDLWPGGEGYFGPLTSRFARGFADFYEFRLPINPQVHPAMHMVMLTAIFAFTLALAVAVAARRVLLAVLIFLIGAGWPATLLAGGNELGRGVFILGGALVLLAGVGERPGRLAAAAAGVVVLGALALSSSSAVAKTAFLDWQHWDFYNRPQKAVTVKYVWDSDYTGVRFPKKRTTVLTIRGPRQPTYWRATTLDVFRGDHWLVGPWMETDRERIALAADAARVRSNWIEQQVTVGALDDNHLIGASIPVGYDIDRVAVPVGQGVTVLPGGLPRDQHYLVWSYVAMPSPAQLVPVRASYPRALTRPGRDLDLAPGKAAPPFGSPGRAATVRRILTGRLAPYALLYDKARAVAGQTSSPYAATVALETWLRATGGFGYAEQPGPTPGLPPLVGFVAESRLGYCQHFAGAMALMLRLLGIPARVAAGFVNGHYRDGAWTVTDHDAHTWVEVWFRGYGWLPFDPTPGRGRLSGSYSSTSLGFDRAAAEKLLSRIVRGGEVFGNGITALGYAKRIGTRRAPGDAEGSLVAPTAQKQSRSSLLGFLSLLAAGLAGAIVLVKLARRRLRYLSRDPRRIATACARDLTDFLRDQRFTVAPGATLRELGIVVRERLSVDAGPFAHAAATARYGPPDDAADAASHARDELRELKRRLRRSLLVRDRVRGLLSLRSLGFG